MIVAALGMLIWSRKLTWGVLFVVDRNVVGVFGDVAVYWVAILVGVFGEFVVGYGDDIGWIWE